MKDTPKRGGAPQVTNYTISVTRLLPFGASYGVRGGGGVPQFSLLVFFEALVRVTLPRRKYER